MSDVRRFTLVDLVLLLAVFLGAFGLRGWYLWTCADQGASAGPLRVQGPGPVLTELPAGTALRGQSPPTELDALVHNLKEYRWFGSLAPFAAVEEKTAHAAPGYPWLLAVVSQPQLDPIDRTVRWLQAGLGAATAAVYFLFARRAFQSRLVGALAGLLCAVHPFWIVNTAEIADGVLATFLLAACIYLGALGSWDGGPFTSFLYGLALAGLTLVRASLLPFAGVALLGFFLRCRTLRRGWLCALLAFLGFANGEVSWAFRNYQHFGDIYPIVNSTYLHLWMGNDPRATGGPQTEQALLEALAAARGEEAQATARALAALPQRERYASLAPAVWAEVRENFGATLRRRLWAGLGFVFGQDWFADPKPWLVAGAAESGTPGWLAEGYGALLNGALLGMLLLGLLGWRWTYGWRREALPLSLALIWVPLPYLLSHAEALNGPRLPLDGVLLCYAAFALACLVPTEAPVLFQGPPEEKR
jgi:hypothetical protein